MRTDTVSLVCVGADDPELRAAAHHLCLTGTAAVGRPSATAPELVSNPRLIVLMAVRGSRQTPVGVAVWACPGPSRRIPSAQVVAVATAPELAGDEAAEVVHTLARGVPVQLEFILTRVGGTASGYVVADVPAVTPYDRLFVKAGWLALQAPDAARTVRHVCFVHPSPSAKDPDEPDPTEPEDA